MNIVRDGIQIPLTHDEMFAAHAEIQREMAKQELKNELERINELEGENIDVDAVISNEDLVNMILDTIEDHINNGFDISYEYAIYMHIGDDEYRLQ